MIQTEIKTTVLQKRYILIHLSWLISLSTLIEVILLGFYKWQQNQLSMHTAAITYTQPEVICHNGMQLPGKFVDYIKNSEKPSKPQLCQ